MVPGSIPGGVTWDFFRGSFRQNHVPWGRLSLWKWVPGISPGVKAAGALGWRPTTLVVPKVEKIRGLNLPGTPRATSACRGIPLLFIILLEAIDTNQCLHAVVIIFIKWQPSSWKTKVRLFFHKYPKFGHFLRYLNTSAPSATISLKSIFILSFLLNLGPPNAFLHSRYPIKTLHAFIIGSVRAAPPTHTCKYASLIWSSLKII